LVSGRHRQRAGKPVGDFIMAFSSEQVGAEPRVRVESVDVLRGLVMVIMALDHTREFFSNYGGNPTDAASAPGIIFFTRWITHLCAPTFVFLAGTSIYLQFLRKPRPQLARFLVSRGLWLMVLELVVVSSMLTFHPSPHLFMLQVIWVTGLSMILMAALIYLPVWAVALFGAALVLVHNAFDWVNPATMGPVAGTVWRLLHVPGVLVPPATGNLWLNLYPLIPWPGIMALGFAFGVLLQRAPMQRQRAMLGLGAASILVFALLRWSNLYGDPVAWKHQASGERTFMSFLDVQKYPPSLLFVLATLGVSLCLMAAFDAWQARDRFKAVRSILSVYGRVPFFYYVLHFTTIHLAALLTTAALGLNWRWWISLPPNGGIFAGQPAGYGFSLPIVYIVWLAIVTLCYFPCRWFADIKQRNRSQWLSYL
jgi:uncharacterized membrane protein